MVGTEFLEGSGELHRRPRQVLDELSHDALGGIDDGRGGRRESVALRASTRGKDFDLIPPSLGM